MCSLTLFYLFFTGLSLAITRPVLNLIQLNHSANVEVERDIINCGHHIQ